MKALLLFLLLATPISARLAEILNECVQRYGQPSKIDEGKNMVIFRKSDLLVICTFHAEKCESISYAKESKEEFSEAEFEVLREANGSEWTASKKNLTMNTWETAGGMKVAIQNKFNKAILVMATKAHMDREQAAKEAREKENLKGF